MLSIQRVLNAISLFEDYNEFKPYLGSILLPDSIRAYTGNRQISHFEMSQHRNDISWMTFPDNLKR